MFGKQHKIDMTSRTINVPSVDGKSMHSIKVTQQLHNDLINFAADSDKRFSDFPEDLKMVESIILTERMWAQILDVALWRIEYLIRLTGVREIQRKYGNLFAALVEKHRDKWNAGTEATQILKSSELDNILEKLEKDNIEQISTSTRWNRPRE